MTTIDQNGGMSRIREMLQQGTIDDPASREELAQIGAAMGLPGLAQLPASALGLIVQGQPVATDGAPDVPPGGFRYGEARDAVGQAGGTAEVDIFAMMELFHAIGLQQRMSAREARQSALEVQITALNDAADQIRTAAMYNLIGGVVSGVATMGAGLATVRAGSLSMQSGAAGGPQTAQGQTFSGQSLKWQGYGQVGQGAGQAGAALFQFFAGQAEAQKAEYEASATEAGALRDNENEIAAAMRDFIRDIQEKLAAMEQANHQTTLNILRA